MILKSIAQKASLLASLIVESYNARLYALVGLFECVQKGMLPGKRPEMKIAGR